jgi:hypothetical protein
LPICRTESGLSRRPTDHERVNAVTKTFPILAALGTLALAAPALAQDVQYELINNSSLTLMEFYSSPVSAPAWGGDILGANVLAAGSAGTVTIADGGAECAYDIRMVFDNGAVLEDSVDICAMASYTITD